MTAAINGWRVGKTNAMLERALEVVRGDSGRRVLIVTRDDRAYAFMSERLVLFHGARRHELKRITFVAATAPPHTVWGLRPDAVLVDNEAGNAGLDWGLYEHLQRLATMAPCQRAEDM